MQVVLVMFRSDGERRSFSIVRDITVIGRREDCDLRIPVGDVSRKHCRLIKENESIRVEDLGSSNGTYINGERLQESVLNPGDWIQVGPVQFLVQIDGVPTEDQLSQPAAPSADETSIGGSLEALDEPVTAPAYAAGDSLGDEEVALEEVEPAEVSDELEELEETPASRPSRPSAPSRKPPAPPPLELEEVVEADAVQEEPGAEQPAAEADPDDWSFVLEEAEKSEAEPEADDINLDEAPEHKHGKG